MRQFVPQQPLAIMGVRPVFAGAEGDARAQAEGAGVQAGGAGGGVRVVVDAHVGQIGAIAAFEEVPFPAAKRASAMRSASASAGSVGEPTASLGRSRPWLARCWRVRLPRAWSPPAG